MKLVDTHCHLDFDVFTSDIEVVIQRAQAVGVCQFWLPGTCVTSYLNLVQLWQRWPSAIKLAFGLHPYFAAQHHADHLVDIKQQLIAQPQALVGEIGLDATQPAQIASGESASWLFAQQVALAAELGRPVILHHRKTLDQMLPVLKRFRQQLPACAGIVHAFSGSQAQAEHYLELGFKLGVGGVVTYPRAQKTRAVIAAVPLTALVLETDAPDMPVVGYQGQRNEPARLSQIFTALCALRSESANEIAEQLYQNSAAVLGFNHQS